MYEKEMRKLKSIRVHVKIKVVVLPLIKACGDVVVWMHAFLALSM
jgi:hypothetical protein